MTHGGSAWVNYQLLGLSNLLYQGHDESTIAMTWLGHDESTNVTYTMVENHGPKPW